MKGIHSIPREDKITLMLLRQKNAHHEERLQKAFQYVRKTFFPRWDKKKEWQVLDSTNDKEEYDKYVNDERKWLGISHLMGKADILARCIEGAKCIEIFEIPADEDELHKLLIHEICHIKAPGHGRRWMLNMDKAFLIAQIDHSISADLMSLIECEILEMFDERLD